MGLRGGLALFTYAAGRPLFYVDPLGLTKWNCSTASLGGGLWSVTGLTCTSEECYGGARVQANYRTFRFGFGFQVRFSGEGDLGASSFDDGMPGPPNAKRLQGDFCFGSFGVSTGIGWDISGGTMGGGQSDLGFGPSGAWGIGAFYGCGSSKLTSSKLVPCCSDRTPKIYAPGSLDYWGRSNVPPVITAAP